MKTNELNNSLVENCKKYFNAFENKRLDLLEQMFSEDVSLKDWNIYCTGRDHVLEANKGIFESLEEINVKVNRLSNNGNVMIAELLIIADDNDPLPVVDVIEFDSKCKIKSIVAYRGN